ncbi:NAD(P)H-binding protein [Streptomyces sp. FIT100]|uniref:NAD(P)H-binding protein n=1 Tax=Streptomyces sp. FIT100 TaxID=2837956 RepID=UPI0021C5AF33|nr:NAD(P)H-binding protein [Streptomyces sp. FIT100]UUN27489.1 NAD(P)H-binding protein [Streptomyces sp. FIT100]
MSDRGAVLVTGATGNTGSRVVPRLAGLGRTVRAAARRPSAPYGIPFDWYDPSTHAAALRGADSVYLVPPVGDPEPDAVMLPFLERARAAGVRRAVLLSSSAIPRGGPAVGRVHAVLPELFDQRAVLRPSWFMQNFTGRHLHAATIRDSGVIMSAAGDGRVGFIDADDIAAVAARALTDESAPGTDLVLTGPQALSYDDIAAVITEVTGGRVTHRRLTPDRLRERLAAVMPGDFAALLAAMDRDIAGGAEDRTTDTVERMTGRPARSFRAFAEEELRREAPADRC